MNNISKKIIEVICFYDIFDYPLTQFEIWQKIGLKIEFYDLVKKLEKINSTIITEKFGFYFLIGRESIIDIRAKRYNYTIRKIKRAKLVANIFKYIPSIKLVAIGNLIGAHNLKNESDIDFFIITKKGTIWTSRFITTSLMKLARLRPTTNNQKDKICLSFFVTENNLNIDKFRINKNDTYMKYWLADLYPVLNCKNTYNKLINSNNWLKKELPNWTKIIANAKYRVEPLKKTNRMRKKLYIYEKLLKKIQLKIIPKELKSIMNLNTKVIINDDVLKFHTKDRRKKYNDLYTKKIAFWQHK